MSDKKLYERLTPDNAAVVMIDHQTGLMLGCATSRFETLKQNALALAEVGKTFGLPVLLTASAPDGPNGPVMSELTEMFPDARVISRTAVNIWDDEKTLAAIKATGRKKLLMAGITTDVCLLFPAISAAEEGFDVYAVLDASGTWGAQAELASVTRMAQAGVKITNWVSVSAELLRDWSMPVGERVAALYAKNLTPYGYLIKNLETARTNAREATGAKA